MLIDMGQGIPRCEECGDYVDEAGRSVVGLDRMGNRAKMLILTCSYRPPPLELVEDRGEGSPKAPC
ncbi:MAG: hypothetical protein IPK60_20780 [Sandaracinaceae bacterium]|nr:hypothetical protein [Sandaracinaceae bacterium]